ncbi:outer membrane protein transport protein, partial [Vibrio campbellii]
MKNMRLFKKSVVAVTVALASQQAVAAGFQLNAQSATGIGRAFAGDAVIADNASVMARNPAAMALFDS